MAYLLEDALASYALAQNFLEKEVKKQIVGVNNSGGHHFLTAQGIERHVDIDRHGCLGILVFD